MIDRSPTKVIKLCYDFFCQNAQEQLDQLYLSKRYALLKGALSHYLRLNSALQQSVFTEWFIDEEYPGFLIKLIGSSAVIAPYFIVPAFPDEIVLDKVSRIAEKIRLSSTSVICLSGSGAVYKSAISISDLDYLEYAKLSNTSIKVRLSAILSDDAFYLMSVTSKGNRIKPNTTQWESQIKNSTINPFGIDPHDSDAAAIKLDLIDRNIWSHPIPVSNLIIFCNDDWYSAAMEKTFAAQEAILGLPLYNPNELQDPFNLGRYVYFLMGQIRTLYNNRLYTKAIKRCLSLSRLFFMHNISSQISSYIESSSAFKIEEINSLKKTKLHLTAVGDFKSMERIENRIAQIESLVSESNLSECDRKAELFTREIISEFEKSGINYRECEV